jgi:mRNA-degrading endonuclease toxin of MazEF toxin-antitoxin module
MLWRRSPSGRIAAKRCVFPLSASVRSPTSLHADPLLHAVLLRVVLPRGIAGNRAECEVMIDQVRAIDNRRLLKTLGRVPRLVLDEVREKLRRLLDL